MDPVHLIDGSGLSSATLPDILSARHDPWSSDNSWHAVNDNGAGDTLTFDLGGTFDLGNLLLWNTDRGVGRSVVEDISVAFAGPNGSFGPFTFLGTLAGDGRINNFSATASGVAFVQFRIDSYRGYDGEPNWHNGSLGEVRFIGEAGPKNLKVLSAELLLPSVLFVSYENEGTVPPFSMSALWSGGVYTDWSVAINDPLDCPRLPDRLLLTAL